MKTKHIIIMLLLAILPFAISVGYIVMHEEEPLETEENVDTQGKGCTAYKPKHWECEHPDGIDLSHHNVAYDWTKVDAKFVYVRASLGTTVRDVRYGIHRQAARRHHIPVGAYHFLTAQTSAKAQFEHFASIVKREHITLRPMLDVEESTSWKAPAGFTNADAHRLIREWCDLCKAHYGKAPILYVTEAIYRKYSLDHDFDDCLWWVANYNGVHSYEQRCTVPFTLHQYSDQKYVEGFYCHIDCNRFRSGCGVSDLRL